MPSGTIVLKLGARDAAGAALALCCALVLASPEVHTAEAGKQPRALEEIVVTAQRRLEDMQQVPVAVTAITRAELADIGFRDVRDIAAQVPALIFTSNTSPLESSFRMRRVGNEGNIPTFEPSTALMIDGAYRSRSAMGLGDLVDVQSVEVLKGPQNTLYGQNASAGIISVTTQPPTDQFEAMGEISYGSDSFRQLKGYLSGPIAGNLRGRLSVVNTRRDPLVKNLIGPDADTLGGDAIRAQLLYDFTERLSAHMIVGLLKRDMKPLKADTFFSPSQIGIIERAGGQVSNNNPTDRIVEHKFVTEFEQDAIDAILAITYRTDRFTLTSTSSLEDYEADRRQLGPAHLPLDVGHQFDLHAGRSYSQELRLASEGDPRLNWLVGLYYFNNTFDRGSHTRPGYILNQEMEPYGHAVLEAVVGAPLPGTVPILGVEGDRGFWPVHQETESLGLFSHVNTAVTETVELTLGLRYSYEEKSGSLEQFNELSPLGCVPPTDTNIICTLVPDGHNFRDDDDWSAITGLFTVSYHPLPEVMLYATYSTGFKAGGFSLQNGEVPDEVRRFDEEKVQNFELGWKTEFWNRQARINGAVFHTTYRDFQNASFLGTVWMVNSADKVSVEGIEMDSTWLLHDNLTARLNLAWIDAEYQKYTGGQCFYGREPDNEELGQCNLSGNNLPFAPKLTGNAALTWTQPLWRGSFYSRLDYRYHGSANYSSELDPRHQEGAYGILNLRLGWRNAHFDIAGWVNNLTDEVHFMQKAPAPLASAVDETVESPIGSFITFMGESRTLGTTLRILF